MRDLGGALGRALDVAGDVTRGVALAFDGGCDARGDIRDAADDGDDRANRTDRFPRRGLDAGDLLSDVLGGVGGLLGERLDLLGDDGEAGAGFAGPCRLDRRIQRQQIGLLRDRGDQLDDAADAVGRGCQQRHPFVGLPGLIDGVAGDPC